MRLSLRTRIPLWELTLWLIFLVNPFIDAITGYLVLSGATDVGGLGSPSQLFRLLLSVVMIVQIRRKSQLTAVVAFILYLICLECFNFSFHGDPFGLATGVTYSYKMAFGLLMYFVIERYLREGWLHFDRLVRYIILSGIIYSTIVLACNILGISFGSYGDEMGSRGVFASANGLGIYIGVCSLVLIYYHRSHASKSYLAAYVLMAYVLLGLMTRAGIGLLLAGLFLWFVRIPMRYKIPVLGATVIIMLVFITPITDLVTTSTEMIVYRFKNADVSFQGLVIGGRQSLFDRASAQFTIAGPLWYRLLIGGGYFLSFRNPFHVDYSISSILEADLWDVFYMFGIIGIVVYLWLFLYGLTANRKTKNPGNYILRFAWVMIFFHSAFAGHVLQNGQSVMMIVCLLLLIKYQMATPTIP